MGSRLAAPDPAALARTDGTNRSRAGSEIRPRLLHVPGKSPGEWGEESLLRRDFRLRQRFSRSAPRNGAGGGERRKSDRLARRAGNLSRSVFFAAPRSHSGGDGRGGRPWRRGRMERSVPGAGGPPVHRLPANLRKPRCDDGGEQSASPLPYLGERELAGRSRPGATDAARASGAPPLMP